MLWLPGQRLAEWLASVDALIDVGPEHASLYLLEIYPNAPLSDEMARGGWSVAPEEDAAEMYLAGAGAAGCGGLRAVRDFERRPGRQASPATI